MAVIGFLAAAFGAVVICAVARVLGMRAAFFDRPDADLKPHRSPVVPLGGAGVLFGLHLGLAVTGVFDLALFVSTLFIWVVGLVDDIRGLSPLTRLVSAGLAGVALVLISDLPSGWHVSVFWVGATVVVVNAVNLLDGMDGLAGSVSLSALAGLWVFSSAQDAAGAVPFVVAIGAILGFLFWNLPPARMFLGDNGAYVVAVTLVWAALLASPDAAASLVGLALIGVPIVDLVATVLRRLLTRQPLFTGDRNHSYDRLTTAGWSDTAIVVMFVAAQIVWAGALLVPALFIGDLAAVLTALVLGIATVLVVARRPGTART